MLGVHVYLEGDQGYVPSAEMTDLVPAQPAVERILETTTRRWAAEPNVVAYGRFVGVDVELLDDAAYFYWNAGVELVHCAKCDSQCRAYEFRRFANGRTHVQCIRCSDRATPRCVHGRRRNKCRDCGGASICEHDRLRYQCRDCCGSSICEHGRQRSRCRECGGSSICKHDRRLENCRQCSGSSFCDHDRQRTRCRDCGSSICAHSKVRRICPVCDPAGHLRNIVASRIHSALRSHKTTGTLEYLGCTIDEFRVHIESTFTPGMTWDNYGTWHIDHITPILYSEDGTPPSIEVVAQRLHWSNTQAMWAPDNIAKGNRWIGRAPGI